MLEKYAFSSEVIKKNQYQKTKNITKNNEKNAWCDFLGFVTQLFCIIQEKRKKAITILGFFRKKT